MKKVVRAVSLMLLMAGVCGNAFAEKTLSGKALSADV